MLRWLGWARQGQTRTSPGQGTGEEAAPDLGHVSQLMVVARQGHVASFPLALLQCGTGYNENKTCSFVSPILQPFLQHTALHPALKLDLSWVKAHLLCPLWNSAPKPLFWLAPELLSWARGAQGKAQCCKEQPWSPFRPPGNPRAPTGSIKSNWGHFLPPLVGLGTGLIRWRKQGVNIGLLQAQKESSELSS